jgi:hypothetical protein
MNNMQAGIMETTDDISLKGKYVRIVVDVKADEEKARIRELNERLEKLRWSSNGRLRNRPRQK